MPARIIESNEKRAEHVVVDPITIDIIENAIANTRHEMDAVLQRTAMSPGIREQKDTFPLITDPDGKMIVGQFGSFVQGFLENYKGVIEEGTIFLLNDPYSCEGAISHLNDWLTLMPIYHGGMLVGWSAMFGHMTDTGGREPSSLPYGAREIFEEGIQIPPVKIIEKGKLDEEMLKLILRNCRMPHWNRSDLMGLIASVKTSGRRICEIIDRFGVDTYLSVLRELLGRNRRAMSRIIASAVPEEKSCFEDYVDDDGQGTGPFKIACSMWREGDRVIFDFDGTDCQSNGSINFFLNEAIFKMFFGALMIKLFDPDIVYNDGFYDLVEVRIPKNSILSPRRPAAVSCRGHVAGRIFDVLHGLLGQSAPDALCAAGFSDSPHFIYYGRHADGRWFQLYQIGFGGIPARPRGDGFDGHALWPDFTSVPNEFLETYFPLRIERYESIPDSGGAGKHRGGNGLSVAYRILQPGEISIHDDRWLTYPWGVKGGAPGARGSKLLVRADGSREWLPAKCERVAVEPDDVLYFNTWGGGGWGNPLERSPDRVALEVRQGLITTEGAHRYGVVLQENLTVDKEATAALRAEMTARRPASDELFNRGGTLDEILARCKSETSLEPPRRPGI
ncbi:MAG: hydantoinase B/oxoprolinase family protein [Saprospiraceae bacterium]|nr:hydantoinase B/oxoprolinase family protein [Saprospiraceae bacterium]